VRAGAALLLGGLLHAPLGASAPSATGQTGLVYMPDARIEADGTWRFGVSHADPYLTFWSSVSLFPRLEVSGRYVRIDGVPGFGDAGLGNYRDKAFDAKLLAIPESDRLPAVVIGAQDYLGTRLFSAEYVALSKRLGAFDLTAGYGRDRIDGLFGGVRYAPAALPRWRFVAEYDANDYRRDHRADLSGAAARAGGAAYAVEYRYGWLGAQLAYQRGDFAGNVYVAVPLMNREFVPKIDEPPPYTAVTPRAASAEWRAEQRYAAILGRALIRQGFQDVRIRLRDKTLELALTHGRISLIGRAVGRAARTALRLGPSDIAGLRIAYTENEQPLLTYVFNDPAALERYFAGTASRMQLDETMVIRFASSGLAAQLRHRVELMLEDTEDRFVAPRYPRGALAGFGLLPLNVRVFFNNPGAPVRYDTFSVVTYSRRMDAGLFLNGAARFTLFENVSDVGQPSNSLLPHVRSDIAEYRREGDRLRLNRLLLNKYALLSERVYTRLSAGYYEEMYAGGGAQVLYLPRQGDWAADVALDWLRQRAPGDAFGFRDYTVGTGIASLHYRFPRYGVTATARFGRFLAKDEGVRLELKRRFRSGVEIGAWYSRTNEEDITSPGSPDNPYRDKGIFVSIPLNSMLTADTQERAGLALADYTRDVGQMVVSPGDLYRSVERALMLDSGEHDPFTGFAR